MHAYDECVFLYEDLEGLGSERDFFARFLPREHLHEHAAIHKHVAVRGVRRCALFTLWRTDALINHGRARSRTLYLREAKITHFARRRMRACNKNVVCVQVTVQDR